MQKIVPILTADEIRRTINRLASQIVEKFSDLSKLRLLGIQTRGVPLAEMIASQIYVLEQFIVPVGSLDITFYRDDLDQIGLRTPNATEITFDITDQNVILVDDVIYKGRTARAALNAVHEYGRPAVVRLVTLVDRGHREVPIHPDFIGKKLPTSTDEQVKVYIQSIDGRDGVDLIKEID